MNKKLKFVMFLLRISLGWVFLWAFADKVWGLGFATKASDAWLAGGSPTYGFLMFATKGPFAEFYKSLAGNTLVDIVFMVGLLGIGLGLLLGLAMRLSVYSAVLMYIFMYTAGFIPPEHNPFIDEHIIYPMLAFGLYYGGADTVMGLGSWWRNTRLVRKFPILS